MRLVLQIPEVIVGAVLGPGAATLREIQRFSGVQIELAKRSEDGARALLLAAHDADALLAAKLMIERAVNEEYARRKMAQKRADASAAYGTPGGY